MARQAGMSVIVRSFGECCLITVASLSQEAQRATLIINRVFAPGTSPCEVRLADLAVSENIDIAEGMSVALVGIRDMHVRIGIEAPANVAVHRWEVEELIRWNDRSGFQSGIDGP